MLCYYGPVVAIVGDHPYFEVFVGMSKVCQRTQPLSCSRHKRNGCRAQAQKALPTMMSGLDVCLRADVTCVWEWGKRRRKFSCLLFCCPMLAGDSSRTGFGMDG